MLLPNLRIGEMTSKLEEKRVQNKKTSLI